MQKIAFVVDGNHLAGGNFVIYRQAQYLKERGYDVHLVFARAFKPLTLYFHQIDVPCYFLKDVEKAGWVYDVVFATWWLSFFYMWKVRARRYFYFCQSDERRFYSHISNESERIENQLFVRLSYSFKEVGFITEAKWIRDMLEREFGAIVEYAPNGVDTKLFCAEGAKIAEPNANGKRRVLVEGPGSVDFKKVGLAFEGLREFREQLDVWFVAGDGVCKDEWKPDRMFSKLSLSEMAAVYRSCDFIIKLSVVEGFFGPPLEMMACGGTAIVSQVSGHEEYIKCGENALSVPLDDLLSTKAAIREMVYMSDERLGKFKRSGLETARALDWSIQHASFERALLSLVDRVPPVSEDFRKTIALMEEMRDNFYLNRNSNGEVSTHWYDQPLQIPFSQSI